jgi:hypothetical protein
VTDEGSDCWPESEDSHDIDGANRTSLVYVGLPRYVLWLVDCSIILYSSVSTVSRRRWIEAVSEQYRSSIGGNPILAKQLVSASLHPRTSIACAKSDLACSKSTLGTRRGRIRLDASIMHNLVGASGSRLAGIFQASQYSRPHRGDSYSG